MAATAMKSGSGVGANRLNGHVEVPAGKSDKDKKAVVPAYGVGRCEIEIIGNGPLLVHQFSEKSRRQMAEKQSGAASKPREKRDPDGDAFGAMYLLSGDASKDGFGKSSKKCKAIHGIPASGFKRLMIRASKAAGAKMTDTATSFFIIGHDNSPYVKLDFGSVVRHDSVVRLESGVADLRYRPEYHDWTTKLLIEFDASATSIAQLVNLLRRGGAFVGWGEDRVEKCGSHGRFEVGNVTDLGTVYK